MSQNVRDALRAKVLGDKPKSTIIQLEDGFKVEVRQSTVGAMLDAINIEDNKQRMAQMLILSCFVPETGQPLFETADLDVILEMPTDGYYRKLVDAMNSFNPEKGLKEAKKD